MSCLLRSWRVSELIETVHTKNRTNRGPSCRRTSSQDFALLGRNFGSQVTIALKLNEKFQSLIADLKGSVSRTAFGLIEGLATLNRRNNIDFELRSNRINHLASILSRCKLTVSGCGSGVVKSFRISDVRDSGLLPC